MHPPVPATACCPPLPRTGAVVVVQPCRCQLARRFTTLQAALFGQLAGEVLLRRAARQYDAESLALAGKLLELHPEVYTVWNYRREALAPVRRAMHR